MFIYYSIGYYMFLQNLKKFVYRFINGKTGMLNLFLSYSSYIWTLIKLVTLLIFKTIRKLNTFFKKKKNPNKQAT